MRCFFEPVYEVYLNSVGNYHWPEMVGDSADSCVNLVCWIVTVKWIEFVTSFPRSNSPEVRLRRKVYAY